MNDHQRVDHRTIGYLERLSCWGRHICQPAVPIPAQRRHCCREQVGNQWHQRRSRALYGISHEGQLNSQRHFANPRNHHARHSACGVMSQQFVNWVEGAIHPEIIGLAFGSFICFVGSGIEATMISSGFVSIGDLRQNRAPSRRTLALYPAAPPCDGEMPRVRSRQDRGPLNGTGRHLLSLKADDAGRRVFTWGIVSRFAEPSQRCGWLFPVATVVTFGELASSRQARVRALLPVRGTVGDLVAAMPAARTVSAAFSALGFAWRRL